MAEPRTWDGAFTMQEWLARVKSSRRHQHKTKMFQVFISPGDLVFDIGANRGLLTIVLRGIGARVVAVEPLFAIGPEYVPEFAWKFDKDEMVVAVPKAISPNPTARIWVHKNMPYLSSGSLSWMRDTTHSRYYNKKNTTPRQVETTTLDELIEEYGLPRFIKVDVEGAESSVIRTLSQPVDMMSMEFHEDWKPTGGMEHMMGLAKYEWNYANGFRGDYVFEQWTTIPVMRDYMDRRLEKRGKLSWGDIYCRRKDMEWNQPG